MTDEENDEAEVNTEEIDTLKAQLAEKEETLRLKDEEIAQKDEELAKEKSVSLEKSMNFGALRKKAEGVDKLKGEISGLEEKIQEAEKRSAEQLQKIAQANVQDTIDEYTAANIGANKEDQEIFGKHFKVLSINATSKTELKQALENAKVLYDKDKGNLINPTGQIIRTHGRPELGSSEQETDFSRQARKQMGVSEEEYKKYIGKAREWQKEKL